MIENINRFLFHILGPLCRSKQVGSCAHNRYIIIEEICRLSYPPGELIIFRSQFLWSMLRPVTFWKHKSIPTGINDKRSHHFVVFAIFTAVFRKLKSCSIASGGTPQAANCTSPIDRILRVGTTLIITTFKIMPSLQYEYSVRQPISNHLGSNV